MSDDAAIFLLYYSTIGPSIIAVPSSIIFAAVAKDKGCLGRFLILLSGLAIGAVAQIIYIGLMFSMWESENEMFFYIAPGAFGLGAVLAMWLAFLAFKDSDKGMPQR